MPSLSAPPPTPLIPRRAARSAFARSTTGSDFRQLLRELCELPLEILQHWGTFSLAIALATTRVLASAVLVLLVVVVAHQEHVCCVDGKQLTSNADGAVSVNPLVRVLLAHRDRRASHSLHLSNVLTTPAN